MSVDASRPSVTTTATAIASNTGSGDDASTRTYIVKNVTATAQVFLAGSNTVTTSNGFQWDTADGPLSIDLEPGEQLWGIVAATTQVLHVLSGGR